MSAFLSIRASYRFDSKATPTSNDMLYDYYPCAHKFCPFFHKSEEGRSIPFALPVRQHTIVWCFFLLPFIMQRVLTPLSTYVEHRNKYSCQSYTMVIQRFSISFCQRERKKRRTAKRQLTREQINKFIMKAHLLIFLLVV